jgi:hypothetical protein
MANIEDLEFNVQKVEGFFNELEESVAAKIVEDGVYVLTKTKTDPAIFTEAVKVNSVPDGLFVEEGIITLVQDEADYVYVSFSV